MKFTAVPNWQYYRECTKEESDWFSTRSCLAQVHLNFTSNKQIQTFGKHNGIKSLVHEFLLSGYNVIHTNHLGQFQHCFRYCWYIWKLKDFMLYLWQQTQHYNIAIGPAGNSTVGAEPTESRVALWVGIGSALGALLVLTAVIILVICVPVCVNCRRKQKLFKSLSGVSQP